MMPAAAPGAAHGARGEGEVAEPACAVTVDLQSDLAAPAAARTLVARHGAPLGPAVVADALLCVSEVVSNAVQHGRPGITLHLAVADDALAVEVTDHGDVLDPTRLTPPDDDATHGRGLHIVAALARAWGVRLGTSPEQGPHKTVWFELAGSTRTTGVAR